jgi:hypothetical protein
MPDFVVENFVATSSGTHAVTHKHTSIPCACFTASRRAAASPLDNCFATLPRAHTHTHALSSRCLCMVATHKHLTFLFLLSYTSSENSVGGRSQRAVFAPSLATHSFDPMQIRLKWEPPRGVIAAIKYTIKCVPSSTHSCLTALPTSCVFYKARNSLVHAADALPLGSGWW